MAGTFELREGYVLYGNVLRYSQWIWGLLFDYVFVQWNESSYDEEVEPLNDNEPMARMMCES